MSPLHELSTVRGKRPRMFLAYSIELPSSCTRHVQSIYTHSRDKESVNGRQIRRRGTNSRGYCSIQSRRGIYFNLCIATLLFILFLFRFAATKAGILSALPWLIPRVLTRPNVRHASRNDRQGRQFSCMIAGLSCGRLSDAGRSVVD